MASRQAILIGAPSVKPALPGVYEDIKLLQTFLKSDQGGAWSDKEIISLIDPRAADVERQLRAAQEKDYVFISCSGHGEHRVGASGRGDTYFYLNENEQIPVGSVNPRNPRHLVLVDACRSLVSLRESVFREVKASLESMVSRADLNFRNIFDQALLRTSEGRIVVYSCDINQVAGDDGTGGVFTQELLRSPSGFRRADNSPYSVLDIDKAFDFAKTKTYQLNAPQTARIDAGRRRDFFPFAIVL